LQWRLAGVRVAPVLSALKRFAQLQVKFPALAPVDPVQCMFETLGMLELGRPKVVWSGLSTCVPIPWPPV
jgi:hypothetical protein